MAVEHEAVFIKQIEQWLGEAVGASDGHKANIVMSKMGTWNIRGCIRGNPSGTSVAAYLGKSEPN